MEQRSQHITDHPTWIFKAKLPHCQIWQHSTVHTIAQAYPVENYERTHARIHRNKSHLVNTLGAVTDHRNHKTYLLIERIPNRLSEVGTLNQSQTLKVLYAVFKGLQQLQQIYGHVSLTQSCVCFNEIGKVKIWVNPDLSSLHPVALIKQSGPIKIIQILYQVVDMVEYKCFNTSFLKIFDKKLKENRILTFRQAAEEILRIGELLFIDIQEKPINSSFTPTRTTIHHKSIHNKSINSQILPERDYNYKHKTQNQFSKTHRNDMYHGKTTHTRKLSNHETGYDHGHRRVQSFIEMDQNKKEFKHSKFSNMCLNVNDINDNNFTLSQAHKSAPPSPREQDRIGYQALMPVKIQNFHKKHSQQNSLEKHEGVQKLRLNNKKLNENLHKQTLKLPAFPIINEDINDSFSHNLKVDEKQIMMSGQFQTFGLLEDLSFEKSGKLTQQSSYSNEDLPKKASEFNIEEMDMQIQRKLEKKNKDNKDKDKKVSILSQLNEINERQINPNTNKPYSQTINFERSNVSGYFNTKSKEKENIKIIDPALQYKRQKSPTVAYIDKKYQEYIHTKTIFQEKHKDNCQAYNMPNRTLGRHTKQGSSYENFSIFNASKMSQFSSHMNSNKNLLTPNSMTARQYSTREYRSPTER